MIPYYMKLTVHFVLTGEHIVMKTVFFFVLFYHTSCILILKSLVSKNSSSRLGLKRERIGIKRHRPIQMRASSSFWIMSHYTSTLETTYYIITMLLLHPLVCLGAVCVLTLILARIMDNVHTLTFLLA